MKQNKFYLPDFPKTPHLPWKAELRTGDILASEVKIFKSITQVTEKIDGANCGIALVDGNPIIRNRDHVLVKGYVKNTAAKKQFASIFNWFYENKKSFEKLNDIAGPVGVYGEWLVAQHGMMYSHLPDWFVGFDLYDWEVGLFIDPIKARKILIEAEFCTVPEHYVGIVQSYEQLEEYANKISAYSGEKAEGIYLKIGDGNYLTNRYKMVREGFIQGKLWDRKILNKNKLWKQSQ